MSCSPWSPGRPAPMLWTVGYASCWLLLMLNFVSGAGDNIWPLDRPDGMPSIQSLEVMCGKDHMDVHLTFSQPFEGIVSSKGQHGDPRCVYVPPSTGQTFFSFRIAYARCGTKPDLHGQFYENTVVVQYDKDLLEVWDEAKRLRCEWFNDYEKTASKPPMVIADLDVIQLDFRGDNVDCWMEIQHGKGPWAPPVSGIVPLGSTLTLVVAINDYRGEFDMRVKSCAASDGAGHVIQLSDEFGCVLRPKMISRFLKARAADERASVITYAFFHAFKFPDALSVHIKCKVEICRHGCLDHCQLQQQKQPELAGAEYGHGGLGLGLHSSIERKDQDVHEDEDQVGDDSDSAADSSESDDISLYDDIISEGDGVAAISSGPHYGGPGGGGGQPAKMPLSGIPPAMHQSRQPSPQQQQQTQNQPVFDRNDSEMGGGTPLPIEEHFNLQNQQDRFPHGPRQFEEGLPPVAAPRSLSVDDDGDHATVTVGTKSSTSDPSEGLPVDGVNPSVVRAKRRKRTITVSDRKVRSADVGVSGLYEVISEADLAFSPDSKAEAVTVFQGRIREEVVYGICLPVPGFSVLFVLVAMSAVISALVAGSLLYRYQMQREQLAQQAQQHHSGLIAMTTLTNWMGMRFAKMRGVPCVVDPSGGTGDASTILRNAVAPSTSGACGSKATCSSSSSNTQESALD